MRKIAVQEGLDRVSEYLSERGYQVEKIGFDAAAQVRGKDYDAVVLSGMSSNFLGIHDTITRAPVIIATGMTEEMIYQQLEKRLQ
ncbi:MAG TPA: YkuS family protein [Thermoclostridium sp.]|nr:YkuS family protein [Clostridiaceae bacterium]HOQ75657.1 YkuS family protein [Thermoclostridium sp.]HPU45543.1 YkuS family protein [Thermoclostridium sp.]